jgi:hypothetical protein
MNPRLTTLLEHRRLEVTRERHEEESAKRQQQQQQQSVKQGGAAQQHNMTMADGSRAVQETPSFASFAVLFLLRLLLRLLPQQAAAHERLHHAHMLE